MDVRHESVEFSQVFENIEITVMSAHKEKRRKVNFSNLKIELFQNGFVESGFFIR